MAIPGVQDNPFPKRGDIPLQKGVGESTSKSTKDYKEHEKGGNSRPSMSTGLKVPSAGSVSE